MENNYEKIYIILGSSLVIIVSLVLMFGLPEYCSVAAVISPLFLTVASLVSVRIMKNPKFGSIAKFNNAFMLLNAAKMMVDFAFVLVGYLTLDKPMSTAFVIVFLLLFLVYLVMDTKVLLSIFKNKDSQPK